MRHRSPLSMVVGCPPTSLIFIFQTLNKDPLIQNILGGGGPERWTCKADTERAKERRGEYPLNQSLFIVQGGLKSTCSGTRTRPYGFITAVQIITAQIPDMDHSSSAPAFLLFLPPILSPVSFLRLRSNILKVHSTNKSQR